MNKKIVIYMIASVILITCVVCLMIYYKPHRSVKNETAAFKLTVTQLVDAFSEDETKANEKYLGKVLEVEGRLKEIILNDSSLVLLMGDSTQMTGLSCYLLRDQKNKYTTLKKGQPVGVKGICNGMLLDVVMDKCILLSEEK